MFDRRYLQKRSIIHSRLRIGDPICSNTKDMVMRWEASHLNFCSASGHGVDAGLNAIDRQGKSGVASL